MNATEDLLAYHSEFQKLVIDLATRFINQPIAQMDNAIPLALSQLVEFLGASHSSINRFSEDLSHFVPIYHWSAPGHSWNFPEMVAMFNDERVNSSLLSHKVLVIENGADLPKDSSLATYLQRYGICALTTVPLLDNDKLFGFISISWETPRQLSSQIVDLLRIVGEIFLNALHRKRNEETIRNFNGKLEQRVVERTRELLRVNNQLQEEIQHRQRVEDALRQSESQFRAILDSLPISILVTDAQENVLYVNPVAEKVFDIKRHGLAAYKASGFVMNSVDRDAIGRIVDTQGYVKDFEVPLRAADGTVRLGLASVQPIQFAEKSCFLGAVVDITELKQTQESEREHRGLTAALVDSAMALTSTLQLDEVVNQMLHSISRVVPHDVANVMVIEGEEAFVLGSRNYVADKQDYKLVRPRFKFQEHYFGQLMAQTRKPVIIGDISTEPRFIRIAEGPVLRGYMGIPIIVGQELIGFISLGSQEANFFTETHIQYLQIFAIQAGIAIQNARLYEQARIIAALEERQRLARELHDSVTQTLFSANTLAEALPLIIEQDTQKAGRYLQDLHQLTRGAMAEMRTLLVELRPEALARTEFGVLLTQLCDVFTGRTQIEMDKRFNKQVVLPPDIQIAFYRIAQEALNNIARHAQATRVQIEFESSGRYIEMRIKDNGRGFDLDAVAANHFGLAFMRERAESIQAEFKIASGNGDGTEIILGKLLLP